MLVLNQDTGHDDAQMRKWASITLMNAKEDYEERFKRGEIRTTPDKLGTFAEHTKSSRRNSVMAKGSHAEDKDNDDTRLLLRHNSRRFSSTSLSEAKDEFEKRRARGDVTTVPDKLGSFADSTMASHNRVVETIYTPTKNGGLDLGPLPKLEIEPSKYSPTDRVPQPSGKTRSSPKLPSDETAMFMVKRRGKGDTRATNEQRSPDDEWMDVRGEALEEEKRKFDLRKSRMDSQSSSDSPIDVWSMTTKLFTTPDELGMFARQTRASESGTWGAGGRTSEDKILNEAQIRKRTSSSLSEAKEEYENRRARGEATTIPDEMGSFAKLTVASLNRKDATLEPTAHKTKLLELELPKNTPSPRKTPPLELESSEHSPFRQNLKTPERRRSSTPKTKASPKVSPRTIPKHVLNDETAKKIAEREADELAKKIAEREAEAAKLEAEKQTRGEGARLRMEARRAETATAARAPVLMSEEAMLEAGRLRVNEIKSAEEAAKTAKRKAEAAKLEAEKKARGEAARLRMEARKAVKTPNPACEERVTMETTTRDQDSDAMYACIPWMFCS